MTRSLVSVDPELCIGSAESGRLLPGAVQHDEAGGLSAPLPAAAWADLRSLLRARRNCPTHAIEVCDENGQRVLDEGEDR